jgi:hypothetical protein
MGNVASPCCRTTGQVVHDKKTYETLVNEEEARKIKEYEASKGLRTLPPDMWGVSMLVIIRDSVEISKCSFSAHSAIRTVFSLFGVIVNLWLQFIILWYVQQYIVDQAVHDAQVNYRLYHKEVFNLDASFNMAAWKAWKGPYMDLCNMSVSKIDFTFAIIFLWTGTMIGEVRGIERLVRDICAIERTDGGKLDTVEEKCDDDGEVVEVHIVRVSLLARISLIVFVIIPKIAIAVILWFVGCRWLCATESFSDLILNALALVFVIDVDEMIFDCFAPKTLQDWIGMTSMVHFKQEISSAARNRAAINGYLRSFLYLIICGVWSFAYLNYLQTVIPDFQRDISMHCDGWFQKKYEPICNYGDDPKSCWPFGVPPPKD